MIDRLTPYPAMKDSGVPWLGEVPEHWDVRRLRNAADMRVSNVDKHLKEGELPVRLCNYVDVYKNTHIRASMTFMRATATADEVERFRLETGDVLITKDSEAWNDIGVPALVDGSAEDLVCGYHLALLRPSKDLLGGYLLRAMQSKGVAYQFHVEANGVTRYGLSHAAIKSIWLPVPPLPEQTAIVRFLDYADRRIRRYIRAKQQLVKLLEEQKQAITHRAITRGLDPNVRLKPSGVAWLGDVPAHWEVVPFKRRVGFQEGPGIMAADFRDAGVPLLRISCLRGEAASLHGCNYLDPQMVRRRWSHFAVQPGDYLLSASASTGNVVRAADVVVGAIPYTGILRLWPLSDEAFMPFVRLYMGCRPFQDQIDAAKSGVGIEHFGPTHLKRMWMALPPPTGQRRIVASVETELRPFAAMLDRAVRQVAFVREYRTRLIADVVTGKLDVREAAARLPDEVDEAEPLDEIEAEGGAKDLSVDEADEAVEEAEA